MRRAFEVAAPIVLACLALTGSAEADPSDYGLKSFEASLSSNQAGGHPDLVTSFELKREASGALFATTRDITIETPPGLLANPNAVVHCTAAQLVTIDVNDPESGSCPTDSQVGVSEVTVFNEGGPRTFFEPVFMMEPPGEEAVARLGLVAEIFPTFVDLNIRSEGDYGGVATIVNAGSLIPLLSARTTLWGIPAAPSHDEHRITPYEAYSCGAKPCTAPGEQPRHSGLTPTPFISNPTRCGAPLEVRITARSYALPNQPSSLADSLPTMTGCGTLEFKPSLALSPTSRQTATPMGLDAELAIPQNEEAIARATSHLRYAKVDLPAGVTIAPGGGDGLAACSAGEVGLGSRGASNCPDAAKIANLELDVPALARTVHGGLYQRTPVKGDLFGVWLVVDELGLHVKLPGTVRADSVTGQLSALFEGTAQTEGLPQAPVEAFRLHFKSGARAVLATPSSCGTYLARYEFAPWSGAAPSIGTVPMSFDEGCAPAGFDPRLRAGTTSSLAGAFASLAMSLSRESSEQNISQLAVSLPAGVLARLGKVGLCEGAAAQSGNCPADSQIGSVAVAAGPGPSPLWVPQPGKDPTAIYLTGPYRGAPYGLTVKVPAQAGPFDLGTVISRVALNVDPDTAVVTPTTDPLPQILEGVPVSYRTIHAEVDRGGFVFNPTSCRALRSRAEVTSVQGAIANPTSPFRVGHCRSLAFKPRLTTRLFGKTNRGAHPRLRAVMTGRSGDANVRYLQLHLPSSEFLDQSHIQTICTRVQFAADKCPAGAIYGRATVFTPVLGKRPLRGPVYLRSSSHELPDLVIALKEPVQINVVGRIDSIDGGIRVTFGSIPDSPVTKAIVNMAGGPRGLLVNSRNLCAAVARSTLRMRGHNGEARNLRPVLRSDCSGGAQGGSRRAH
jgi:hypothetical protein